MPRREERGEWSAQLPNYFTPRKDPVLIVQEAGWVLGQFQTSRENLASLGFDPRTIWPIVSCYTDNPSCLASLVLPDMFV